MHSIHPPEPIMNHAIPLSHVAGSGAGAAGMPWIASAACRSRQPAVSRLGVRAAKHPDPRVFAGI
jgi:hypothetical protein